MKEQFRGVCMGSISETVKLNLYFDNFLYKFRVFKNIIYLKVFGYEFG